MNRETSTAGLFIINIKIDLALNILNIIISTININQLQLWAQSCCYCSAGMWSARERKDSPIYGCYNRFIGWLGYNSLCTFFSLTESHQKLFYIKSDCLSNSILPTLIFIRSSRSDKAYPDLLVMVRIEPMIFCMQPLSFLTVYWTYAKNKSCYQSHC